MHWHPDAHHDHDHVFRQRDRAQWRIGITTGTGTELALVDVEGLERRKSAEKPAGIATISGFGAIGFFRIGLPGDLFRSLGAVALSLGTYFMLLVFAIGVIIGMSERA
ncbi:MAG: hypothetical protein R6V61_02485 [Wenzhouxiangellaceae bacterium]